MSENKYNDKKIKENIRVNLKKYRKEEGLTQKQLANKLNVAPTTLSSWEQGLSSPNIDMLVLICSTLNIGINKMVGISTKKDDIVLTDKEKDLIIAYREADDIKKILILEQAGIKNKPDQLKRLLTYYKKI